MSSTPSSDWFGLQNVREKIRGIDAALAEGMNIQAARREFSLGRDLKIVGNKEVAPKALLTTIEGQARLLHDLANIELQAMELATRSLYEYPDAPAEFRKELAELASGEARHLKLCLDGIEKLGYSWGHWDVHLALWDTVSPEDTLLDRILIVHRYLEGAGLDAGDSLLRRLGGIRAPVAKDALNTIVTEEVDHVHFGSKWYRRIAELNKIDPEKDFADRIGQIARLAPKRERISRELRLKAGFTEFEIAALEEARLHLGEIR